MFRDFQCAHVSSDLELTYALYTNASLLPGLVRPVLLLHAIYAPASALTRHSEAWTAVYTGRLLFCVDDHDQIG